MANRIEILSGNQPCEVIVTVLYVSGFYLDLFIWGGNLPPHRRGIYLNGGNCAYAFRDIFGNGKLKQVLQNI